MASAIDDTVPATNGDVASAAVRNNFVSAKSEISALQAVGSDKTETAIHGATAKTTPVDADTVGLIDSAAANVLKKVTWANIKATLKTYFDALYSGTSHTHSTYLVKDGTAKITVGTTAPTSPATGDLWVDTT